MLTKQVLLESSRALHLSNTRFQIDEHNSVGLKGMHSVCIKLQTNKTDFRCFMPSASIIRVFKTPDVQNPNAVWRILILWKHIEKPAPEEISKRKLRFNFIQVFRSYSVYTVVVTQARLKNKYLLFLHLNCLTWEILFQWISYLVCVDFSFSIFNVFFKSME